MMIRNCNQEYILMHNPMCPMSKTIHSFDTDWLVSQKWGHLTHHKRETHNWESMHCDDLLMSWFPAMQHHCVWKIDYTYSCRVTRWASLLARSNLRVMRSWESKDFCHCVISSLHPCASGKRGGTHLVGHSNASVDCTPETNMAGGWGSRSCI